MDWTHWTPRERAALCFIVKNGEVLLIHKQRGLGAGKVNGPGGKLEPGETPLEAGIRETQEEIGVTPLAMQDRGLIHFQFTEGYSLQCTVFLARDLEGVPCETPEAIPFWRAVEEVPYDEMWEDDRHWLPQLLGDPSVYVHAWFEFDGERMLSKEIRFETLGSQTPGFPSVQAPEPR